MMNYDIGDWSGLGDYHWGWHSQVARYQGTRLGSLSGT